MRVLIDSSAFLSLEDPNERSHVECREALADLVAQKARLLTTNFVFDEAYTLILTRLGRDRAVTWGERFRAGRLVRAVRVDPDHEEQAWQLILAFADKEFSYTDATSFAVAASLDVTHALSLDRHFHQYGRFEVLPPAR